MLNKSFAFLKLLGFVMTASIGAVFVLELYGNGLGALCAFTNNGNVCFNASYEIINFIRAHSLLFGFAVVDFTVSTRAAAYAIKKMFHPAYIMPR